MEYPKLYNPTLCIALISVFLLSGFVFAQPVENSSFTAKATNALPAAESFYALHVKLHDPGAPLRGVDTLTVNFPSGFDVTNASIVQALNDPTLTIKPKGTLIFKYNQMHTIESTIVVDGIVNPYNTGTHEVILTGDLGGNQVFGPLRSKVQILPYSGAITIPFNSIDSKHLKFNSIDSKHLKNDSITGRELAGVSKILFFDCNFKVNINAVDARGINLENHGWVTTFGRGGARCDAPGVEEDDLAILGPMYDGHPTIIMGEVFTRKDWIQLTFWNFEVVPFAAPDNFHAPVIVFKK
jgi:hypothetical protein